MYLVLPTNDVLNTFFTTEMEPVDDRSQRALDPKHARQIGDYIVANPTEYALGAITYAVDQEGEFEPFEEGADIGLLHLPLTARLRSVDGQHRRRGIKDAIDVLAAVGEEHTALLIYVESRLDKRKQMFSDMNNTARVVSKAINVAFDSRDPFARAVNVVVAIPPPARGSGGDPGRAGPAGQQRLLHPRRAARRGEAAVRRPGRTGAPARASTARTTSATGRFGSSTC